MLPGDRLDALLIARARGARADEGEMAPLVDTAARFASLAVAEPDPAFVDALEAQLLARAAAISSGRVLEPESTLPVDQRPEAPLAAPTRRLPARLRSLLWPAPFRRRPRLLWPAIAAALLLVFAGGTLGVAAAAPPGSPFYSMHQWEDEIRVSLAASPADRARLHLRYATDALDALDRAVAQHAGNPTYRDALATLQWEAAAAERDLAQIPAGAEHDTLAAQAADLRTRAWHDLRAALSSLSWPDRLVTTATLGALGDTVPTVASAHLARTGDHQWQVTLSGSGFQPGAVLLVNGVPAGKILSLVASQITAELTDADTGALHHGPLGVGNPDGTAAETNRVTGAGADDRSASATQTAAGGDHGGTGGGDNRGGHGGDHGGTPTPTPR